MPSPPSHHHPIILSTPTTYAAEERTISNVSSSPPPEGRRDITQGHSDQQGSNIADSVGRTHPRATIQTPSLLNVPPLPPTNLPSGSRNYIIPPRTQPRGERYRHDTHEQHPGEQSYISFSSGRNRAPRENTQPEADVPQTLRVPEYLQSPRLRENLQGIQLPLADHSLNEGSGIRIQSIHEEQEGFALYGDVHTTLHLSNPLPRNLGLYYAGIDAAIGGLPVTCRVATNNQHFVLAIVCPDSSQFIMRPA